MLQIEKDTKHLLNDYITACNYPGDLNPERVEQSLRLYLDALGQKHKVVRLERGWKLSDHPSLSTHITEVLSDFSKRLSATAARAATAATAATDARAAIAATAARAAIAATAAIATRRFASWCIQSYIQSYRWWYSELSWLATTHIGAVELKESNVTRWSEPIFEAFISGAWILFWTKDVLYWVAKPEVFTEKSARDNIRLHNSSGPSIKSDVEDLYFWHGVMVPDFVILNPRSLTHQQILSEPNAEVRRVMIERFGLDRFLSAGHAKQINQSDRGVLYRMELAGDEPIVSVKVKCSTTGQIYFLRVPPSIKTADDAVAWTFGFEKKEYAPIIET